MEKKKDTRTEYEKSVDFGFNFVMPMLFITGVLIGILGTIVCLKLCLVL